MNAKEYLGQIEALQTKIEQKKQRAKELRMRALSVGSFDYSKEKVQTSPMGDQLERAVVKYISLEQETEIDMIKLEELKNRLTSEIHDLDDARYIKLLYKRYVETKSLNRCAKEMNFAYQHIRAMHSKALKEFEKKM